MVSQEKPAGRKVVVLREGPPAHRTAVVDGVFGVLGVALLVLAGVLGETLPEEDVIPVQYETAYPLNSTQAAIQYTDAAGNDYFSNGALVFNGVADNPPMPLEGESHEIGILVERDNVISFNVRVVIDGDDFPSSLADVFKFELFDPEGQPLGDSWRVTTLPPQEVRPDPTDPENATFDLYVSPQVVAPNLVRFRGQPEAEFIGSDETSFTREEALLVASERYTLPSRGTVWTLRMSLDRAGDCEPASPDPNVLQRRAHCLSEAGAEGQDPGNPIIVSQVLYDYYLIQIRE